MKIVCIGGGPAGLYFGLLMKKFHPEHDVTVVERNRPYDTFGWGVVFSDQTMQSMRHWDPESAGEIQDAFNHWDDIEVLFKGTRQRTSGHGFVGIGRRKLLNILQARCEALGVNLQFETEAESDLDFPDADLVIASDGVNSRIRAKYSDVFQPDLVVRPNRYIWLGTKSFSTPSPLISARRITAGFRRISTSSTTRPRPLSSRRRKKPIRPTSLVRCRRTSRSGSAKTFSPKRWKGRP